MAATNIQAAAVRQSSKAWLTLRTCAGVAPSAEYNYSYLVWKYRCFWTKGVWSAFILCGAILLPSKGAVNPGPAPAHSLPQNDKSAWQANWAVLEPQLAHLDPEMFYACARNSLYMFLHLSGNKAVSFDEVKAAVPLTAPYGASLNSLLEAAKKLRCDAQVRLYNPKDFTSVPLPAIVHLSNNPIMAAAHFGVMYKTDAVWVYLIDGTTAEPYKVRRTKFSGADWWTGYALIQKRSSLSFFMDNGWPALGAALLVVDIILFVTLAREFKRRRRAGPANDCHS